MLRTLRITSFRGLREFAMAGLGRVNLLVGTNNCGKTSVLEAIHILSAPGSSAPVWQAQTRRGELVDTATERETDVAHLFYGHTLSEDASFAVAGDGAVTAQTMRASLLPRQPMSDVDDDGDDEDVAVITSLFKPMYLQLHWSAHSSDVLLPVTRKGGLRDLPSIANNGRAEANSPAAVLFIATDGLSRGNITSMFERVVLTPDEETVLSALRTIEPEVERIATIGHRRLSQQLSRDARGGLAMMVAGQRIPIGSMGDGIWRLLGISLALVRAKGGVLLVDEIDTGLHYSVLVDLWKLVLATARSLDVQVFATTHSRDCYEALAAVTQDDRHEISLQRIERGKPEAVGFTEAEIRQAAERGLEVR